MTKAVGVILVNEENKLLFNLRDNKPTIVYPDFWSFIGGGIEINETPKEALKREIKEEIGLDFQEDNLEFLGKIEDEFNNHAYVYLAKISKRIDEIVLTEGQRLEFFKFEEINKLKMPKHLKRIITKNKQKILNFR